MVSILFVGCSTKKAEILKENLPQKIVQDVVIKDIPIYDLENIPQKVEYFTTNIEINTLYDIQKKYEKSYYSVWNLKQAKNSLSEIKWPFTIYSKTKSYGENLQLLEDDFFTQMLEESNFKEYSTINENAITIKLANIRSFPTDKPLLKDPSKAGEGFPFDYIQNSTIAANKPLFVSHYSLNKKWVYIFSSFTYGWIKADELVFLDKKYTKNIQESKHIRIIKDNIPINTANGKYLFDSKIGMILPLIDEDESDYTVLIITSYKHNKPLYLKSKISKKIANLEIMILNKENLSTIINDISKTKYGWGGMYEQRDCSSSLRDLFAPFGIWLPRNSYQQSKIGKVISLENLTSTEKIKLIKENALPFQTLLYKKGHILLYVGLLNNEIIAFHNTWGIKTLKSGIEGRIIIGGSVFSSLSLGKYQLDYDEESEILRNLKSMNILTQ